MACRLIDLAYRRVHSVLQMHILCLKEDRLLQIKGSERYDFSTIYITFGKHRFMVSDKKLFEYALVFTYEQISTIVQGIFRK